MRTSLIASLSEGNHHQQQQVITPTTQNPNAPIEQQQTIDIFIQCMQKQTDINIQLTNLMEKLDIHMQQQNLLMKQLNQLLKSGPNQYSTTLSKEIPPQMEIHIDNETKLKLHGLHQHYVKLRKNDKSRKLIDLLGKLEFNQVAIFVKSVSRCTTLCKLLTEQGSPAIEIHREILQEKHLTRYKEFKEFQTRILVATNLFERDIDIECVNIVALTDRFGTKGLATIFVVNESDAAILNEIQSRFEVQITEMPDEINAD
ncbi:unnamed protein product, partial [Rotaria sp. Silwood2]